MRRQRHWQDKSLAEMTERDWRIFREDFAISYKGGRIPLPFRSWDEAKLPDEILKAVRAVGYEKPSPIQMASIPVGLQGALRPVQPHPQQRSTGALQRRAAPQAAT